MYNLNETELFRERHLALVREAEDRHRVRLLRKAAPKRSSRRRNEGPLARLREAISLWGRAGTPFFRA